MEKAVNNEVYLTFISEPEIEMPHTHVNTANFSTESYKVLCVCVFWVFLFVGDFFVVAHGSSRPGVESELQLPYTARGNTGFVTH